MLIVVVLLLSAPSSSSTCTTSAEGDANCIDGAERVNVLALGGRNAVVNTLHDIADSRRAVFDESRNQQVRADRPGVNGNGCGRGAIVSGSGSGMGVDGSENLLSFFLLSGLVFRFCY